MGDREVLYIKRSSKWKLYFLESKIRIFMQQFKLLLCVAYFLIFSGLKFQSTQKRSSKGVVTLPSNRKTNQCIVLISSQFIMCNVIIIISLFKCVHTVMFLHQVGRAIVALVYLHYKCQFYPLQLLTDRFNNPGSSNYCTGHGYCGGTFQGIISKLDYIQGLGMMFSGNN